MSSRTKRKLKRQFDMRESRYQNIRTLKTAAVMAQARLDTTPMRVNEDGLLVKVQPHAETPALPPRA